MRFWLSFSLRPSLSRPRRTKVLAGIVIVSVAVGVLVTVLILHYKHKKTVLTGCVTPVANGLVLTDEKNKRSYTLSGDLAGLKPGDRMALEGKRKQSGQTLVFDTRRTIKDYGACQP